MLQYQEYTVIEKRWEIKDTFVLSVKPTSSNIPNFKPGQYIVIKNPTYRNKEEEHIFSLVSSPHQDYLEFCIKVFGNWTRYLSKAVKKDKLLISTPSGNFVWDDSIKNAVFISGGIGISPIVSMLRYIKENRQTPNLTLIFATTTPEMVPYKTELEKLQKSLPLKIVPVYSETTGEQYTGVITQEMIKKEVDLKLKPTFFYCGSNSFLSHIEPIIKQLKIPQENIKSEARD